MFRGIQINGFPPFEDGAIMFPPVKDKPVDLAEVYLFTGVNGSGKSRMLSVLAAMMGGVTPLQKRLKGFAGTSIFRVSDVFPTQAWSDRYQASAGNLAWRQGTGLHNRAMQVPAFAYGGAAYIADSAVSVMKAVPLLQREACLSFVRPPSDSDNLLQAIVNLKIEAGWEAQDDFDKSKSLPRALQIVRDLELAISSITQRQFRFRLGAYANPSLSVDWGDINLAFDALPDGLRSIIGWLAHAVVMTDVQLQGKRSARDVEAVFLLDDIEGPLHPAWQRKILPAFQRLFPKSQIFVATHSPFVIASLNYGWIYPFLMDKKGR